ncbi:cyclin-dependent kinase 11B-like [Asterias rubens]|uniref:cyclin-dependent kinase 11B-like n=1 Tax=Asterias rubens TaxID=7604 RepID=UPI001455B0AC|nr:cyclin-dependent kinase 11B-like [Asterias rubens]XP_033642359.1 cyclin-dependent kinase 11B-like [Asterias rubens]
MSSSDSKSKDDDLHHKKRRKEDDKDSWHVKSLDEILEEKRLRKEREERKQDKADKKKETVKLKHLEEGEIHGQQEMSSNPSPQRTRHNSSGDDRMDEDDMLQIQPPQLGKRKSKDTHGKEDRKKHSKTRDKDDKRHKRRKRSHSKDSKEKRGHERGRQVKDHRRDETRSSGVRDRNPIRHSESRYQDNARHSESRHVEVIGDSGRYVDSSRHNDGSRHGDGNRYSDLVRSSDQERHGDSDRYRFEREQSRRDRERLERLERERVRDLTKRGERGRGDLDRGQRERERDRGRKQDGDYWKHKGESKYESRDYERQDRRDEEEIDLTTRDRTPLREQDAQHSWQLEKSDTDEDHYERNQKEDKYHDESVTTATKMATDNRSSSSSEEEDSSSSESDAESGSGKESGEESRPGSGVNSSKEDSGSEEESSSEEGEENSDEEDEDEEGEKNDGKEEGETGQTSEEEEDSSESEESDSESESGTESENGSKKSSSESERSNHDNDAKRDTRNVKTEDGHHKRSPQHQHVQKSKFDVTSSPSGDEEHTAEPDYLPDSPPQSPIELKEKLPPYFPAVSGCRSVEEFVCLNKIEEGAYGVVYRAKEKRTDQIVALKRLKMEKEKEGFPITSLREVNTLLKSQHPNIVTVREIVVGSNMDKIYIVMDYVEHDLKSLMETMKQPFTIGETKCLMLQLLRGVHHLHDNWILHRDLKTSNLLLSHRGVLKIGDFGLAREYGSPLKHYTPIVVTLWYRAPELLLGTKEYSCPIDMWSVGCIFAEFIKMKPLFPGRSEVDQLNRIFKELGTPSEKIWTGYNELPAVKKMTFAEHPYNNLRERIGTIVTDPGFDLMNRFLTYNPERRISADDALHHSYFREKPLPIDESMFPTWPAKSEMARTTKRSPKAPEGGLQYAKLEQDGTTEEGFRLTLASQGTSAKTMGFNLRF